MLLMPLFCLAQPWCEYHFKKIEHRYNIPSKLLHAIALTESGIKVPEKGMVAWPWSINVHGKGFAFQTKQQAIQAAQFLKRAGIDNFDVGCMQINMLHHPDAFATLEDAFDPEKNVTYAAHFLKSLHSRHNNWEKAYGDYHNIKPHLAKPYKAKVSKFYNKLHQYMDYSYLPNYNELPQIYSTLNHVFATEEEVFDVLNAEKTEIKKNHPQKVRKQTHVPPPQTHHPSHHHRALGRVNTMTVRHSRYNFGHRPTTAHKNTTHPVHLSKNNHQK
ncbi:MAG: hypothetical protein NEHIOOID_00507 [Holosporales bacterium]